MSLKTTAADSYTDFKARFFGYLLVGYIGALLGVFGTPATVVLGGLGVLFIGMWVLMSRDPVGGHPALQEDA